jgi:hypothetical protein
VKSSTLLQTPTGSSRRETKYVLLAGLGLATLTSLPFVLGAVLSTPALEFGGFVIGFEDGNSYLAEMVQGAHGSWLYRLAFTPEAHSGGLFFVLYLLLGKIAHLLGAPPIWLFHLSRFVATPLALYAFYRLAAYFSPHPAVRRLATALFAIGGGLGWLWALLGGTLALGQMPVDLWVPDASFFLSVLTYPHLIVGQALLFAYVLWTLRFLEQTAEGPTDVGSPAVAGLAAAFCGLGVSLIHPYTLPVIAVPLGLFVLWRGREGWPAFRRLAVRLGVTFLPSLPYLAYSVLFFRWNPAYAAWQAQNLLYSPTPYLYVLGFGLPLLLAVVGLLARRPDLLCRHAFLWIWVLAVPLLLYAPTALQRRFLDGYQAPLAIVAGAGLYGIGQRLRSARIRSILTGGLVAISALTNVLLLGGSLATVAARVEPVFHPAWEMSAARWFESAPAFPVVLASYDTGNLLPGYTPIRSFVGHGSETVASEEKLRQVAQFFATDTSNDWRRDLLSRFDVSYVYCGPRERRLGTPDLQTVPFLQLAYDNGPVQIYRVAGTTGPSSQ